MLHINIGILTKIKIYTVGWWRWDGNPNPQNYNYRNNIKDALLGEGKSGFNLTIFVLQIFPIQWELTLATHYFHWCKNTDKSQNHLILVLTNVHSEAWEGICHLLLWTLSHCEVIHRVWWARELSAARCAVNGYSPQMVIPGKTWRHRNTRRPAGSLRSIH